MGCVSSKNNVSVTPAVDYSGAFRSNVGSGNSGRSNVGLSDVEKKRKKKKNESVGLRRGGGSELGESRRASSNCNSESSSFRLGTLQKYLEGEQVAAGWPAWLSSVAGEAIQGWVPLRADAFEKLEKIGQGTYSSVFRARELETGKTVAMKKVRFDNFEPESVRFMAREIMILRKFDHPNIIKLEGIITSRLSSSIYLVFEYMEHDIAGLLSSPDIKFSEPQIKCYMKQLLSGLEHCHSRGIMHRDIKGSNLLVSNEGILKVADFGLANFSNPGRRQPLTSRVVTLWYRPPELLLGSTNYGEAVDLWSVGCVFAELLIGKPILQGKTEVEQLHKIFKLCGTPSDEYWTKSRLPHSTLFRPRQQYDSCVRETFKDVPASAVNLLETLLSVESFKRGTASSALSSGYFKTKPYACDPSSLPSYPPSKEFDAKYRQEARRERNGRRVRGPERRKPSRKPLSISKLAPAEEELTMKSRNLKKSNSYSVPSIEENRISLPEFVHAPKPPTTREDASHVKNASQGDLPCSGPLQVSTSSGFAWAKRRNDDTSKRSHSRTLSRGLVYGTLQTSICSSKKNSEENKDLNGGYADNRKHGTYERSEFLVHSQWGKFDRPDSFDASEGYHSQELSMALYDREEMDSRRSYLSYQDQAEKVEFSGPLLSQMSKIDELLERHERHIRQSARKSWFQIGKKHHG